MIAVSIFAFIVAAALVIARPLLQSSHNRAALSDLRLLLSAAFSLTQGVPGYDFLGHPSAAIAYNDGLGVGADVLVRSGVLPERFGLARSSSTAATLFLASGRIPVSVSSGWPCPGDACVQAGISLPTALSVSLGTFDFPIDSQGLCTRLLGFPHPALALASVRPASDYSSVTSRENPGPHVPYLGATTTDAVTFTSVFLSPGGYTASVRPMFPDVRSADAVATACAGLLEDAPVHILLVFSGVL